MLTLSRIPSAAGCQNLKKLLSFAIGGLLGDVFLHLLPEAWAHTSSNSKYIRFFSSSYYLCPCYLTSVLASALCSFAIHLMSCFFFFLHPDMVLKFIYSSIRSFIFHSPGCLLLCQIFLKGLFMRSITQAV